MKLQQKKISQTGATWYFNHPAQFEINKNSTTKPSAKIFKFEIQPINISKQPTWYVFLPRAQPPGKKKKKNMKKQTKQVYS